MNQPTLVTALYNHSPNEILGGRGWGFQHYLSPLLNLLKTSCPMVFYTHDLMREPLELFLKKYASSEYTLIDYDLLDF